MISSTKGRYALRVMIDLAQRESDEYVPLQEIAEKQGISTGYVNGILKLLVEHDKLLSLRGKGGGYKLMDKPENYSVGEILRIVEGNLAPVQCVLPTEACERCGECHSMPMWKKLDKMINDFFDGISLQDLLDDNIDEEKK